MRALLAAACFLAASAPALAQTGAPQTDAPQGAPTGGGYRGYGRQMSPEVRAAMQTVRRQCAADIQKLCADSAAPAPGDGQTGGQGGGGGGRGRMMQCIREHRSQLSSGCSQAMEAMRAARRDAGQGAGGPGAGGPGAAAPGAAPQG
jgi:hypothetical protein